MVAGTDLGSGSTRVRPFISVEGATLRRAGGANGPGIWWQILKDQHWAVVGPNGSGKSTLVKKLSGRMPAEGGRIVHHFADGGSDAAAGIAGEQTAAKQIAYVDFRLQQSFMNREVPYHQARWNSLSSHEAPLVSEYLSEETVRGIFPYQVTGSSLDPEQFRLEREQVAHLLGIEVLLGRRLVQLSSGERRKVLLARALLQKPRLLILDNPFAGLDCAFRLKLRGIIERLMLGQMAVMLVTTAWEDLPAGITHVLVLAEGRVVAQGPRESVQARLQAPGASNPASRGRGLAPRGAAASESESQAAKGAVLVQMEGVSVSYGGLPVLDGIEWTMRRGEHWALLGPNGAGKSTLLSLLLGDNPKAYANRISLFGRRRGTGESIWEVKQRIGWVAPELQFVVPRGLSCLDVVCSGFFDSVGLFRPPSPRQREAVNQWLAHLRLSPLACTAFGSVSEGEQRMVLLARAVVKDPSLLILDEPCQGLDARYRTRVLEAVDEAGCVLDTSVIYVTHNPLALPAIISHVLKLDRGRITDQGRVNGHDLWSCENDGAGSPRGPASGYAC